MKKLILTLAVLVAAGIGAWFVWRPAPAAPDVAFTTIEGKTFSMHDLRGKVVLVKFWATSCVTCVKQMPGTIETYHEYAPKGYEAVAVAMSRWEEHTSELQSLMRLSYAVFCLKQKLNK